MQNKIISILCIFILISFCFINNIIFASESGSNLILDTMINSIKNDTDYSTGNYDFIICPTNTGYIAWIVTKADGFYYWTNGGRDTFGAANNGADVAYYAKSISFNTSGIISSTGSLSRVTYTKVGTSNIYYSTFDMYGDKACTEIVFSSSLDGSIDDSTDDSTDESNKALADSIDIQTEAIKENTKTSKNIFERIGDILSYLNPFSENFFAYKLVEILLDGLKGLFIPGDNYFKSYFDELNNWFSEKLGFLYYPLELLFNMLDRMLNINFKEPVINIPDIKEPTTNITLIKATSFNFNSLLNNSVLSNVHNIYLLIVDAGIYMGLVALLMKKYEEVMTK